MIKNLEKITYGKKVVCPSAVVIGTRRYGWELKRTCRPCFASEEGAGRGAWLSAMNYRRGNIQLYIPATELKPGRRIFLMDGNTKRIIRITSVCPTCVEWEVEKEETRERKADRLPELPPLVLENDGELDNPLDEAGDLVNILDRDDKVEKLHEKGFYLPALQELEAEKLDELFMEYGG